MQILPPKLLPAQPIPLSPIDQVMPRVYTRILFFFAYELDTSLLVLSLKQVLAEYDILYGRLAMDYSAVLPSDQGIPFTCSTQDNFESIKQADWDHYAIDPSFQPCDAVPTTATSEIPLIVVKLVKAGVDSLLSLAIHHCVADGPAFYTFIKRWSILHQQLLGGETFPLTVETKGNFERSFLQSLTKKSARTRVFSQYQYVEDLTEFYKNVGAAISTDNRVEILKYSANQLEQLKLHVQAELSSDEGWISTMDVLYAHLWRHITQARSLPPDDETALGYAVNARERLQIEPDWFGNVNLYAFQKIPVRKLLDLSLAQCALRLRSGLLSMDHEYCVDVLNWLHSKPDKTKILPGFSNPSHDLAITTWGNRNSNFADVCFEKDRAVSKVRLPFVEWSGLVIIIQQADGGVECYVGLDKKAWSRMAETFWSLLPPPSSDLQ